MISQNEINILINTLSNIYDWSSENLEDDFVTFIQGELTSLSKNEIVNIFNKFDSLPTLERESAHFDLELFVRKNLKQ